MSKPTSTTARAKQPSLFTFKHGEILDTINDHYYFMTGEQITRRLYPKDKSGNYTARSGNAPTIRERLAYLTRNKYLHAHHLPTTEGQRPYGYHLALKGRQYEEEERDNKVPIYWEKNQIEARSPGWKMHLLELNNYLITTDLLPVFDPTLKIAGVTHDLLLKRKPYEYLDSEGKCYTLQPDAIIEIHQEREGRKRLRYILWVELDRGTNDNLKFRTHLSRIYAYIERGYAEKDFGTSNITVVFPTTDGDKRVEHMRQLARLEFGKDVKETQRRNQLFLYASFPPLMQPQPSPLDVYETPYWYTAYGQDRKVRIIEPQH